MALAERLRGQKIRRKAFHSFRHTFKSACRAAGVGEEYHDDLSGHQSGDVGDDYGEGYPVTVLEPELAKVKYQGLDLSHLQRLWPMDRYLQAVATLKS